MYVFTIPYQNEIKISAGKHVSEDEQEQVYLELYSTEIWPTK